MGVAYQNTEKLFHILEIGIVSVLTFVGGRVMLG